MTEIVHDEAHSRGAPTIAGTEIRVVDVATAYDSSGYEPDEITQFYPTLSLADVHAALDFHHNEFEWINNTSIRRPSGPEAPVGRRFTLRTSNASE